MMKRIVVIFIVCVSAVPLSAGSGDIGTDAFLFMRLGLDARGMALGGSRVAGADDISAMLWNPAGLAATKRHQVLFSNAQIFKDQDANYVSYAGAILGPGVLSLSMVYVDLGEIDVTKVNTATGGIVQNLGRDDANDFMVTGTYAWETWQGLDVGISFKYAREELAYANASSVALDAGLRLKLYNELALGLSIQNLGPSVKFISRKDDLPLVIRAGVSKQWFYNHLLTEINVQKPTGNTFGVNLGCEFRPLQYFSIRLGWDSLIDAGSGLSAGFGVAIQDFKVDYAYVDGDEIGDQHRISLGFAWGYEGSSRIDEWFTGPRKQKPISADRQSRSPPPVKTRTEVKQKPEPVSEEPEFSDPPVRRKIVVEPAIEPVIQEIDVHTRLAYQEGLGYFLGKDYQSAVDTLKPVEKSYADEVTYNKIMGLSYYYLSRRSRNQI